MKRARRLWVVALCAVPLSQLGHAISMQLHAPGSLPAAGGRHAYFAATLEGSLALLGAGLLAALVAVATARRLAGRPLRSRGAWPLPWLVLALAAAQLEIYFVQELLEGSSSYDAARYGLAGQVPVALVAALALRWLSSRLGPALRTLRTRLAAPVRALVTPEIALPVLEPVFHAGRRPGLRPGRAPPY